MSDIVERLRDTADAFELAHAPHHLVLHMRAGAAEIERLRAGGCARDQGTTQYCAEAARLAADNERLRAALRQIAEGTDMGTLTSMQGTGHLITNVHVVARAALEGK